MHTDHEYLFRTPNASQYVHMMVPTSGHAFSIGMWCFGLITRNKGGSSASSRESISSSQPIVTCSSTSSMEPSGAGRSWETFVLCCQDECPRFLVRRSTISTRSSETARSSCHYADTFSDISLSSCPILQAAPRADHLRASIASYHGMPRSPVHAHNALKCSENLGRCLQM